MSSDINGESVSHIRNGRMPSLGALRCFEAAARLESFTRAAAELHLTHGAISRAVRILEDDLDMPLFERRSRRVFLTKAGKRLCDATAEAFGAILAATDELRRRGTAGSLVLSCEPTLMMRWLIPRLPNFQMAHPAVALHLAAGGGPVPFAREGIDVAIRRNDFELPAGVQSTPIMSERVGPVCSPAVAQSLGAGTPGLSLADVALLHTRTRPTAWADWSAASGCKLGRHSDRQFEHFYFSLQAASAGLGVAIGPFALVQQELEAGTLVAPFGFLPDGSGYLLLGSATIMEDPRVQALLAWLQRQV